MLVGCIFQYYFRRHVPGKVDVLYEEWFHCADLGSQIRDAITRFFASEAYATKIPAGPFPPAPYALDSETSPALPVNFTEWCEVRFEVRPDVTEKIDTGTFPYTFQARGPGSHILFDGEFRVDIISSSLSSDAGSAFNFSSAGEVFLCICFGSVLVEGFCVT